MKSENNLLEVFHILREHELKSLNIDSQERLATGNNEAYVVTFEDSTKGIYKPAAGEKEMDRENTPVGTYYRRERAAYLVSQKLGFDLVPVTVIREVNGRVGSIQDFVEPDKEYVDKQSIRTELFKLWLFDYLNFTSDRNEGNTCFSNGHVVAIDNGLAFGNDFTFYYQTFWNEPIPEEVVDVFTNLAETPELEEELVRQIEAEQLLSAEELAAFGARLHYLTKLAIAGKQITTADLEYFNPETKTGKIDSQVGLQSYQEDPQIRQHIPA